MEHGLKIEGKILYKNMEHGLKSEEKVLYKNMGLKVRGKYYIRTWV